MEYKIGFVILHYNAYKETIQCAKSIMDKLDTDCYEIIIVDNDSPNKSLPIALPISTSKPWLLPCAST